MIRWASILFLVILSAACLLFPACDGGGRQRIQLEELEAMNRADSLMTNDSLALALADWFDRHGTANEQMRAHYILGRTYADLGEAPQAIKSYQDAIDRAVTTSKETYHVLCRVYSQMSGVLYAQNLLDDYMQSLDQSVCCAWKANDTLAAMRETAFKMIGYTDRKQYDSVVYIFNNIQTDFYRYSSEEYVSEFCMLPVEALLALGRYEDVGRCLSVYEHQTGFFDAEGNIAEGREVYYYYKGKYYLAVHQLDSAAYFFRKELSLGCDFNNQNAAALGLAQVYVQRHQTDSAAKYALYAYAMNDSVYHHEATAEVARMKSLFDYSRYERQAQKERERAVAASHRFRLFSVVMVFSLVMISLLAGLAVFVQRSKRRYAVKQYQLKSEQLKNANQSLALLREQGEASVQVISEKERDIVQLQAEIDKLLENRQLRADSEKAMLADSEIGHLISSKSASGQKITESEWEQIGLFVKENMSGFSHFLAENHSSLGMTKKRICILLRLYAGIKDTGVMLGVSAPYVSQQSGEILSDLFQISGSGKKLADKLRQIQ
jgi:tetratricopeptide (TPR) repeat protein